MNFQKYFLQSESVNENKNSTQLTQQSCNDSNNTINNTTNNSNSNINNNNSNNSIDPLKKHIPKNQQYELDRKKFFKENRERAKPLLSKQGLYNRRYENNFEWGHNTIINFRGVKGTDWTRDHGFTYANDFNTLERDVDPNYLRPDLKNCRFCLDAYPDTEPHNILENEPPTEIGGCVKCHPERYTNDHHNSKDDYYPVKSNEINDIKPSDSLSLYHNTRNCASNLKTKSHSTKSLNKIQCNKSSKIKKQPRWKTVSEKSLNDKSESILIDQNNTNVFIGDYHCRDRVKSHLNKSGFHSDNILPAGVKSVNNTVCRLKNVTYDNTSNIFFNDEFTAANVEKEKPSYKGLIRYTNHSFIPFNHVEYNPNPGNINNYNLIIITIKKKIK